MKALTLTQPWAQLMALGEKRIETRSWYTSYRGELVIHAAKGFPKWAQETCEEEVFCNALGRLRASELPLGVTLCVVRLLACIPTAHLHKVEAVLGHKPSIKELEFGDYSDGRYLWVTDFVRHLPPHSVRGALGLWEVPAEVQLG